MAIRRWKHLLLPEELRTRRLELHISQADLARRLRVSQQTISRWEHGSSTPGPRRIAELGVALRLDLAALLRSAGYLHTPDLTLDTVTPLLTELERMTATDLVRFIDAGWQQLRVRLDR